MKKIVFNFKRYRKQDFKKYQFTYAGWAIFFAKGLNLSNLKSVFKPYNCYGPEFLPLSATHQLERCDLKVKKRHKAPEG